jgi:hypothetical protein
MNLQIQFQMEDIIKKRESANKKKSTAITLIVFGGILIFICLGILVFNIIAINKGNSAGALSDISTALGCCFAFAAVFGILGAVLLALGITRRSSAIHELNSADEQNKLLRTQMLALENQQKKT